MRLVPVGDTAFSVQFGDAIDEAANARVMALMSAVRNADLPGVVELVPSFCALLVVIDPLRTDFRSASTQVEAMAAQLGRGAGAQGHHWSLKVRYDGPDLDEVARACGLSPNEVVEAHAGTTYRVHMLGFLPGFAYMAELPPMIRLPRRSEPRLKVAAGSVAIADAMTAIYPWESPGGWHLIGHTDTILFDQVKTPPALLAPGDTVAFEVL
ncbi:MAG: 5-oxoprolinase subunit PxpB [Magnetospirillum sp.]|nr:5-oxoprolinase subunit PxpB [Magnetospirillum sp.]